MQNLMICMVTVMVIIMVIIEHQECDEKFIEVIVNSIAMVITEHHRR